MAMRIVIVGGVAGGMSAATRARRVNESAEIVVLEKGGFVSFANCGMPYYLAGRIVGEEKLLVTTAQRLKQRFNIDVRVRHEATRIDRAARLVEGVNHATGERFQLPYDKLILAPGAEPIVPAIAGIRSANVFQLRSMEDTQAVHRWLAERRPRTAVVVGAGFIGLEMAEALRDRGLSVTVVEKAPQPLPQMDEDMAGWVSRELAANEVRLIVNDGLAGLSTEGDRVTHVQTDSGQLIPADLVLLSIGVRPLVKLATDAGLAIGASGGIAVDAYQRTSDPHVYAVGDAVETIHAVTDRAVRMPLAGPANRQGRAAGEHAAGGAADAAGAAGDVVPAGKVLGTAIVQVFKLSAGLTGLTERAARMAGFDVDTAYVHAAHHAGYYPGAQQMHVKLVYDRGTGRVLGGQIAGGAGVDKRLDVLATLMHFRGTIDDLGQLDLAYAPQFGSAKDPLHLAAFVAQNQRRGLTPAMRAADRREELVVDVRTAQEHAGGTLSGAVNIPVDELRGRLGELDRSRPIAVLCQVGLRGHIATRMLKQNGFEQVRNIKGGWVSSS